MSQAISKFLLESDPGLVQQLTRPVFWVISESCKQFKAHQELIRKMVEAALLEHTRRQECSFLIFLSSLYLALISSDLSNFFILLQGCDYELHTICGVNTNVHKDGRSGYMLNRDGYPFSHINVWVRRRGQHADAARKLLFIECSNDSESTKDASFLCTPLSGASKDSGMLYDTY